MNDRTNVDVAVIPGRRSFKASVNPSGTKALENSFTVTTHS
jgi:hypothetical protein